MKILFSLICLLLVLNSSFAGRVIRTKSKVILIKLEKDEEPKKGAVYTIYDSDGRNVGKVKIRKVRKGKAIGAMSKRARGKVRNGYTVQFERVAFNETTGNKIVNNKKYNLKTNPGGILFGVLNVELDYKWSKGMTMGAYVASFSIEDSNANEQSGTQFGVIGNYHLSGQVFTDGMVISGSLGYLSSTFKFTDSASLNEYEAELAGPYLGGLGAYHWYWQNWNVSLGLGFHYFAIDGEVAADSETVEVPISGIQPVLDLGLGYAF